MTDQEWTVGQEVIVSGRRGWAPRVARITRVLKKYVEVGGMKFNNDGGERGWTDAWSRSRISAASPEQIAAVREECERMKLVDTLCGMRFGKLSASKLRRILAIVNEPETP